MTISVFFADESGFIISAELVIISTLVVLGLIVGLSQVQHAVVGELNDVAHSIGSLNQSFYFTGFRAFKWGGRTKSSTFGSAWFDFRDSCDWNCNALSCAGAVAEGGWGGSWGGGCGFVGSGATGGCSGFVGTPACGTSTCSSCAASASCSPVYEQSSEPSSACSAQPLPAP